MHKNVPVIALDIINEIGVIVNLKELYNPEHLPIGTTEKGKANIYLMDKWWKGRSIPASRDGIEDALLILGKYSRHALISKCYGLSLSDQYWISPDGMGLKWENVNFFQNEFSKDVGEILFGDNPASKNVSLISPDNTSDGVLRKKWIIVDGKRVLMKGASKLYESKQEPFNEGIASALMRRLDISHTEYMLIFSKGRPYSLCENFVTPFTELVPAWRIYDLEKRDPLVESIFRHLLRCCEKVGIFDIRKELERMLTLDYIIMNCDRHLNNFGFIRDAETLEWKGFAPIFNSGSSLWYNSWFVGRDMESKPFRGLHDEQIKLVSDLSWFNYKALDGIEDECLDILKQAVIIDEGRHKKIAEAVALRCKRIEQIREQM
jgi:hypothetical protein